MNVIESSASVTLLGTVDPKGNNILSSSQIGLAASGISIPGDADVVFSRSLDVEAGDLLTIANLTTLEATGDVRPPEDLDCEPLDLEKIYALVVRVASVSQSAAAFGANVLLNGVDTGTGLTDLDFTLNSANSTVFAYWPDGLDVFGTSTAEIEEVAAAEGQSGSLELILIGRSAA